MTVQAQEVTRNSGKNAKRVQEDKNYIEVMGKIFAVLEFIIAESGKNTPLTFAEISSALPFARTTVHRILYSLQKLGYLEKDKLGRYHLSSKFFDLTASAVHFRRLRAIVRDQMQNLLLRFGETVNLGVLDDGEVTYIDVLQSPSALRIAAVPGERNPVHCTALGKSLLAYLPEPELHAIVDKLPLIKLTPKTITQKKHLLEHLSRVREQGIAVDVEENVTGVVCVAAPIFDPEGRALASISISGPAARMGPKLAQVNEAVRSAAVTASRMLSPAAHVTAPRSPKAARKAN